MNGFINKIITRRHQRHFPKCRTIICTVLFICSPSKTYALLPIVLPNDSVDIKNRMEIQDYIEKAVAAHPKRDKKLLAEFWSVAAPDTSQSSQNRWACGTYIRKIPTYWGATLRRVYKNDKSISVISKEVNIVHHPFIKWVYGVTLHLIIKGEKYSDSGYMFMAWDFRNLYDPQIQVRTWQPEYIDKEKGLKLNPNDVYSLSDFDF